MSSATERFFGKSSRSRKAARSSSDGANSGCTGIPLAIASALVLRATIAARIASVATTYRSTLSCTQKPWTAKSVTMPTTGGESAYARLYLAIAPQGKACVQTTTSGRSRSKAGAGWRR